MKFTILVYSFYELLCLFEGVELAYVHELKVFLLVAEEGALVTVFQVEVDDAEAVGHLAEEGEHTGRQHMDA